MDGADGPGIRNDLQQEAKKVFFVKFGMSSGQMKTITWHRAVYNGEIKSRVLSLQKCEYSKNTFLNFI